MRRKQDQEVEVDTTKFVNALGWDQLRKAVKLQESLRSGFRDPSLAATWSDVDCKASEAIPNRGESERMVHQIIADGPNVSIRVCDNSLEPSQANLNSNSVDVCFSNVDCWIGDIVSVAASESNYDLELGLLESVQQISIEIAQSEYSNKAAESQLLEIDAT